MFGRKEKTSEATRAYAEGFEAGRQAGFDAGIAKAREIMNSVFGPKDAPQQDLPAILRKQAGGP